MTRYLGVVWRYDDFTARISSRVCCVVPPAAYEVNHYSTLRESLRSLLSEIKSVDLPVQW